MKILFKDLKHGVVKIKIESLDDLWYLSTIIDAGDYLEGETYRKVKVGKDENTDAVKKKFFLKIDVEKTEFSKFSNTLRLNGTIIEGPEDVPKGSYHTISVEDGSILKIEKKRWLKYQIERISEAAAEKSTNILLCIFDREDAILANLKKYGHELLTTLKGDVQKKAYKQTGTNFYSSIKKVIEEYESKYKYDHIIIASPSFFREYLLNEFKEEPLKKKIVTATCSSVSASAINEVLKRDELKSVLQMDRASKEIMLVEEIFSGISKDNKSVYGFNHVKSAVEAGAVKKLVVTDRLIQKMRMENTFDTLEKVMAMVENSRGEVHLISTEHDGGKKLEGLGGIAGCLRYSAEF